MKKVVVLLMILVATASFAQEGGKRKGKLKNMSPEQVATLQTKKATLALDLSERQQEQIKALLLEKAEIRESKMAAQKGRKDDLGEPVTVDERFARESERLDYQIAQKEKLQQILSKEQMAKWEEMQKRRGHRGKQKGRDKSKR
ncbi:hypothetical protein FEE95_21180 [Maribacter algarum]|uniref:Periplasmic heavy metal sensor n=1 Tax=Maribacter algarum (ex Zhang et al. 2020) TaxID=2578118 RepID=A0A5S3PDZ9_9FLAO|nr:hypothetical protein [Maribacter algarum]TMM52202.1 hypothetical protein FEE95_21180 [Maribacter algarum]